jgi:hypothetical protein
MVNVGQLAIDDVQIRPAHGAGLDANPNLAGSRHGIRTLLQSQRCSSRT